MAHQLTMAERVEIENGLRDGKSFSAIAKRLKMARSTVKREVSRHRQPSDKGARGRLTNRCVHRMSCTRRFACNPCGRPFQDRRCSHCSRCNEVCKDFVEHRCERLSRPPYVCNGCGDEYKCVLRKMFYSADAAQAEYRKLLVEAREGAAVTAEERAGLSSLLAGGLRRGQSIHHMMTSAPDEFTLCERTIYAYVRSGVLQPLGVLDLPEAPKMKPRRKKGAIHRVNPRCEKGRGIDDYRNYLEMNPDTPAVEMDSVLGRVGGRLLLTFHFDSCGLMLAFIREANTSQSVIDIFNGLETRLGTELFKRLFPVILTDNGSEFSNPDALEGSVLSRGKRTRIFYCDPYASWQKPHVENNHRNLRKIFPKGASMDAVTQEMVNRAVSHMNSALRLSQGNVPAITRFGQIYGKEVLEKLDVRLVEARDVCLTPQALNG